MFYFLSIYVCSVSWHHLLSYHECLLFFPFLEILWLRLLCSSILNWETMICHMCLLLEWMCSTVVDKFEPKKKKKIENTIEESYYTSELFFSLRNVIISCALAYRWRTQKSKETWQTLWFCRVSYMRYCLLSSWHFFLSSAVLFLFKSMTFNLIFY